MPPEPTRLPAWAQLTERRRAHVDRVVALLDGWAEAMALDPAEARAWHEAGAWHDALRDADEPTLRHWSGEADAPVAILHGPAVAARLTADGESRADVVEAIEAGQFHLWAIERIEEGIEILTGTPAGATRGADGKYPEGTIFRRVEDRLEAFARGRTPQPAGEPSRIVMPSTASRPTPGIPPGPPPEPPVSV